MWIWVGLGVEEGEEGAGRFDIILIRSSLDSIFTCSYVE